MKSSSLFAIASLFLAGCSGSIVDTDTGSWLEPGTAPQKSEGYYSLPVAHFPIEVKCEKGDLAITMGDPVYQPDVTQPLMRISYHHSIWSNDTINIQTANGLLTSSGATAINQIPAIISAVGNLAETLSGSPMIYLPHEIHHPKKNPPPYCGNVEFDVKATLDPNSPPDAATIENETNNHGITISIQRDVNFLPANIKVASMKECVKGKTKDGDDDNDGYCSGLYFRPPAAFDITVHVMRSQGNPANQVFTVLAPDSTRILYVPFNRRAFTQYNVQLAFDHGMLTKFQSTDDSEALAVLSLPGNLLKAIFGLGTSSSSGPTTTTSAGSGSQ